MLSSQRAIIIIIDIELLRELLINRALIKFNDFSKYAWTDFINKSSYYIFLLKY